MVRDWEMMNDVQLRMARARLRLGIVGVGFWVVLAVSGLVGLKQDATGVLSGWMLVGGVLGLVLVQGVLDGMGGMFLMPPPRPGWATWLGHWLRGVSIHTGVLMGMGLLSVASFRFSGGFCGAVAVGSLILAGIRPGLLGMMAGSRMGWELVDGRRMRVVEASDPGFTGGLSWGWGRVMELVPKRWLGTLPADELGVELERRRWQLQHALPRRAWWILLGWNLAGVELGSRLWGFREMPEWNALAGHACWMTLWCFAGLLVLPSLSRGTVYAADRAVLDSGLDPRPWIRRLPQLTGEDGSSAAAVQAVFYPIPATTLRLAALGRNEAGRHGWLPGSLARNNLYYSWATLTPMGRVVHCNVGRPALWVFPPEG